MATGKKVLRCIRCGDPIQYEDKNKPGYVSPDAYLNRKPYEPIYCEKCYQEILESNKMEDDIAVDERIYEVLDDAIKTNALIVWVVDLASFNGLLPSELAYKLRKSKVIVVGTRKEFFPKPFKEEPIKAFLKFSFKQFGIEPLDIIPINGKDQKEVLNAVERVKAQYKNIDTLNIYLIGAEKSGKTTLINNFLKNYENNSDRVIARVEYKNTGIKLLEMPISNRRTLYVIPGYSNNQSILAKVEKGIHKYIVPKKALKMTSIYLGPNNSALIGSIAAVNVRKGKNTLYKLYSGEAVEVRKALIPNVRKAIMTNKINEIHRPVSERLHTFGDYDCIEFSIKNDNKTHEIAIEGLGFLTFKGVGQTIWMIVPKGTSVNEGVNRY